MTGEPAGGFSVSIKGTGLALEREVTADVAMALIAIIMGGKPTYGMGQPNPAEAPSAPDDPYAKSSRRLSLREFLNETRATRNTEKIVAIAEFLNVQEQKTTFNGEDIKARFKSAAEPTPANFPRDFALVLKNGWVAEDPDATGSYYVTKTGRSALDGHFGNASRGGGSTSARGYSGRIESSSDKASLEAHGRTPGSQRRRNGGSKTTNWRIVEALLDEPGRASLKDFYRDKRPRNQNEQVAVLAFKLKELTARPGFDGHEIHTAFQIVNAKTPRNLVGVFGNMTGSGLGKVMDKKFIANFKAEDIVKHDLPPKDDKNDRD
ncbi:MAG: hypothetical protein E5Y58_25745 [Mesorhizobium sp.]|nr:MAG: hypothetical protein E5Y58_25745 [Mesorhizobium sp.]